jgi:hypothetical protein
MIKKPIENRRESAAIRFHKKVNPRGVAVPAPKSATPSSAKRSSVKKCGLLLQRAFFQVFRVVSRFLEARLLGTLARLVLNYEN